MNDQSEDVRHSRLAQLYSDRWKSRLKGFVARKYYNFGDWEGWFEEAHQNLAVKIDQLPIDREISDATIFAVFKNELVSVKRHRLGYPRPRKWLQEFSDLGQDLFEWMCLHRLQRSQVIEHAMEKSRSAAYASADSAETGSFQALLEKLTKLMIEKKECDGVRRETTPIDGETTAEIATTDPSTEENTEWEQLRLVLSMILGAGQVTDDRQKQASECLASIQSALKDSSLLSDPDILILRCYYFQGMSQNEIAKLIGQPLQKIVRRRESAIKRIREFMEQHGLDRQSLL